MQCSNKIQEWHPDQIDTLKTLLNCEHLAILERQGGNNSKVFCAEADGKRWAIKSYPPYVPNQRNRLAAECMVYQFLNQQNIPSVPRLKSYNLNERWLIIDWIAGEIPRHYSKSDIHQAIQFISCIARLNHLPEARDLPLAAEACLSLDSLLVQIKKRLQRLMDWPEEENLINFLIHSFIPTLTQYEQYAREGYNKHNISYTSKLPQQKRSLIPADFGFHNSLRNASGQLYFFDFDYFGWDDPVKLLADILWHPKMNLSESEQQQFIQGISKIFSKDSLFLTRFHYTWPLFGLRWILILLNEFIPVFGQDQQHPGTSQNLAEAKITQLERAKKQLSIVQQMECSHEFA